MSVFMRLLVILLAAGLVFGLAGCPNGDDDDEYSRYFEGSYRNNRNGSTEVVNNASSDMLLFEGKALAVPSIVGGVRAGSRANINFSNKTNYQVGGWVLLQAVRVEEFRTYGALARVDHGVMAVFGANRQYTTTIESTTDGNFEFEANNFDERFALELRENSPVGRTIAFLPRSERNRVIRVPSSATMTIFPTWVAIDTRTMTPLTLSPAGPFQTRTIAPIAPPGQRPHANFPVNEAPVFNPRIMVAGINVINNTSWGIRVGIANQPFRAASGRDLINPGQRDSFEIEAAPVGLNMTITVPDGHNVSIPVRKEGETGSPVLQNGSVYTIAFAQLTTTPSTNPDDWSAVIIDSGEADINAHLESP